ncbi:MAG: hypothetical protein AB1445_08745 [Bacillota bacterium]
MQVSRFSVDTSGPSPGLGSLGLYPAPGRSSRPGDRGQLSVQPASIPSTAVANPAGARGPWVPFGVP